MKRVLLFVLLSAASASGVWAQDKTDVKNLLKVKGPPTFTARSIDARGNLLVCDGLELFDAGAEKAAQKLRGRVLLFCDPWDGLWLGAASTGLTMSRATPLLGLEGPGGKFLKTNKPSQLLMPAKVFAAVVDDMGMVVRTAEITVHELRCQD
jgi:hypothetical protein